MIKKHVIIVLLVLSVVFIGVRLAYIENAKEKVVLTPARDIVKIFTPTLTPTPNQVILPNAKTLQNNYHIFQTFNNCGPASLSMILSYYGIQKSQEELGQDLRPYQIAGGDNDDKSVTLSELAEYSKQYGLIPYHRPMGNEQTVKQFIALDLPVLVRTWTKPTEDIGHFRVIKGYDDVRRVLIQDDSLQGGNLEYSYSDFNELWKKFNYEYVVLVPQEKKELAENILGENKDENIAWQNAVKNSESALKENPNDIYTRFNLSVALYNTKNYKRSVEEFERVKDSLPFRTLWYQIEPIQAYYEIGMYDDVLAITQRVLDNQNRAFSELYYLRGKVFEQRGQNDLAKEEFQKAHIYNTSKF